ncbi:unnamed protein product [Allacma fusca]|uniref:Uncharacterized protein n=1 Tax=Allacma fusca TaxID=39272 RepID=A0A8J2PQH7_9HEXA|nr:unnamed protein product [Allacma fusca]
MVNILILLCTTKVTLQQTSSSAPAENSLGTTPRNESYEIQPSNELIAEDEGLAQEEVTEQLLKLKRLITQLNFLKGDNGHSNTKENSGKKTKKMRKKK